MYFGHDSIREELERRLPQASVFLGPVSVGKWEMAEHLRRHYKVNDADVLRVKVLSMDNARMIVRFAETWPVGSLKVVIVRLRKMSSNALNVLLKTLEEAGDHVRFFLIAEELPPATVVSRAVLYPFGLLREADVEGVLLHVKKFQPDTAKKRAEISRGQLFRALGTPDPEVKSTVLSLLRAFKARDFKLLEGFAPKWTDEHTELLTVWCNEAITERWSVFKPTDADLPGQKLPLRLLIALRAEIRPRLVVRHSLLSVLRGLT